MSPSTTVRPKPINNHRVWRTQTAIAVVSSLVVLNGAVAPALSQPGTILNEIAVLGADPPISFGHFGYSIALDGDMAIVGMNFNDGDDGAVPGKTYEFLRIRNGLWIQQAKLQPSIHDLGDKFGSSIAISGDTAIVGAPAYTTDHANFGSAFVFVRNAHGIWTEQTKFMDPDGGIHAFFGSSVSISGDTIVVSELGVNNGASVGSVFVFVRDPNIGLWREQAKLQAPVGGNFLEGKIVDDTLVIVGAPTFGGLPVLYVFVRNVNGIWIQQATLMPSDGMVGDNFGTQLAFNGSTIVVGAPKDDDNGSNSGSVYIFTRDTGGAWTQQAKLLAPDGAANDFFGSAVAISSDTAVVGAPGGNSAYTFVRDASGVWTQKAKLVHSMGSSNIRFGSAVAISNNTVFVGAINGTATPGGNAPGAVYVFILQGSPADLTGDGVVNSSDLAHFLFQWGCASPPNCIRADFNGDGAVNAVDLAFLLANWG